MRPRRSRRAKAQEEKFVSYFILGSHSGFWGVSATAALASLYKDFFPFAFQV